MERKIAAERGAEAWVSDRTAIDYLAYWLHNQAEHEPREQNVALVEMARGHLARYERCVFLPWREAIEAGAYRNEDPVHNLRIASSKRGLLAIFGVPTVDAPYVFGEDIRAWIERHLRAPAPVAAPLAVAPPVEKVAEFDEAAVVERVLAQARREFGEAAAARERERERLDASGGAAGAEERALLDRRIEKLARALEDTEGRLKGMIAAGGPDPGVASVYRAVQGLAADDPRAEQKKALLQNVFLESLELKRRLKLRAPASSPEAAAAAAGAEGERPASGGASGRIFGAAPAATAAAPRPLLFAPPASSAEAEPEPEAPEEAAFPVFREDAAGPAAP
jgi:hypothetical protein